MDSGMTPDHPDFIRHRDYLLSVMRKQNIMMQKESALEVNSSKRGRKPAPSKRIAKIDKEKPRNKYNWFDK
jgi:hypothetical protein